MKRINLIQLCTYLTNVYEEATEKCYSNNPRNWYDTIKQYENNANYVEVAKGGKVERYDIDELTKIASTGKWRRVTFSIEYITTNNTVKTNFYINERDFNGYGVSDV